MPIIIKKLSQKEKNHSLVKRFTNAFNNARMLDEARSKKFRIKKISKTMQKKSALRRLKLKEHYDRLEKMGRGERALFKNDYR